MSRELALRELAFDDIVTEFLLKTCRLCPPSHSRHAVYGALLCGILAAKPPDDELDTGFIPLTSGSVAEFYTDPMLPHIGDIDVMYHHDIEVAIPQGHPPPTQLPAKFHNHVMVLWYRRLLTVTYLAMCT